jgi:UDP-N-acetylglucosamine diphosphorylase/glucosamine-1-phosphate N-acetyltransferase
VKAAILAAGRGERLRPLTETRPKPLLPILGEPILCRNLRLALSHPRVDEAVILAPKGLKRSFEALPCVKSAGDRVEVIEQERPLGTGHALRVIVEHTGYDDYLVVYSDIYLAKSAWSLVAGMEPDTVLLAEVDDPSEYGVAIVEGGMVKGFVEKPLKGREPSRLALTGVYALSSEALRELRSLKPSPRGEFELTDILNKLASNRSLGYVSLEEPGAWRDIGRPWDYLLAARKALGEELEPRVEGDIHPTAVIEGPVYIAPGARVKANSVIEGPSYIGPEAEVGPCGHIRPYTILSYSSKAGFATEVKASILLEEAKAPHLNYVGDSIIGEHVNLGAGTITANLRFDKASIRMTVKGRRVDTGLRKLGAVIGGYAQTGINVSLMPGVKVGSYARIWPGCRVARDVPSGAEYKC